ncbi:MAG: hypothetical protein OEQ53_19045, partial [Saprospiraceae bacterium]|nr:hypothetical protein [Saprospiraceae bacterium]
MKRILKNLTLSLVFFGTSYACLPAQIVSIQYRHVPQDNIAEFIHRETTYWSQVAQKAVDDGKLVS